MQYTPITFISGLNTIDYNTRSNLLGLGVLLGGVDKEITDTLGVTPLVVVPADQLDKVGVESNTGRGVEDGRVGLADKVRRDNAVLSIADDALSKTQVSSWPVKLR
jgi:hypothetical protein